MPSREDIFAGINFRKSFFFGYFAGINSRHLEFTKDLTGINFHVHDLYKDFAGMKLCGSLKEQFFPRPYFDPRISLFT